MTPIIKYSLMFLFVVLIVIHFTDMKYGAPVGSSFTSYIHHDNPSFYPDAVEAAVKSRLRDPDSAQFGHMDAHGDRKWKGKPVTAVCGSVNSKNGFGGYVGFSDFVYIQDFFAIYINTSTNNGNFVKAWNTLCAGKHW